jgi:uncharacterized protein YqhQ
MPESFTQSTFSYGGQAVIEGVMMRGSKSLAVAARSSSGEIVVHTEPLDPRIYGGRMARIPFLRGLTLLWDALGLGIKSLMFSADVALEEENDSDAGEAGEVREKMRMPLARSAAAPSKGQPSGERLSSRWVSPWLYSSSCRRFLPAR